MGKTNGKRRASMRIHSWTARGWRDYEENVHPKLQELLSAHGRNTAYAELAITTALRLLLESAEDTFSLRVYLLGTSLRVVLLSERGVFPTRELRDHVAFFAKNRRYRAKAWTTLGDKVLERRRIWRILSPVEYVLCSLDGRKVTLLFRLPLPSCDYGRVEDLARRLYLEDEEVVCPS